MQIKIEPQLTLLSLGQLASEVSTQTGRVIKIKALITDAEKRIAEEVKAFAAPGSGYTPEERTYLQQANVRQSAAVRLRIRKETDALIIPILKATRASAADAKARAERHYDKFSILRRATGIQATGFVQSQALRASFAEIFEQAGPTELARWAQWAIDSGDPVMADAVIRANNSKPTNDRTFNSQSVLDAIPNSEYEQAQASCQAIIEAAEAAGLAWSEFENDRPDAMRRIAVGLRKMDKINEGHGIPEAGSRGESGGVA